MQWSDLISVKKWSSVHKSDFDMVEIKKDFYKLSDNQYCMTAPYSSSSLEVAPGGPFITAFLWACSEGAARRAYFYEIEADDKSILWPPDDILPFADNGTYGEILKGLKQFGGRSVLEHARYRIMSDGAFVDKVIESALASYFFRKADYDNNETPYAIQWNLLEA
jgi:hypothetical protein